MFVRRFALDLYKNVRLNDVDLLFTNPFAQTSLIQYNFLSKELFTWDQGNLLTYPIRYNSVAGNSTDREPDTGESKIEKVPGNKMSGS